VATPAQILNIGTSAKQNRFELQTAFLGDGSITTVSVATLAGGYNNSTVFTPTTDGSAVLCSVQEGAPLTSVDAGGSRTELREMALDGTTEMAFDATVGDNWISGTSRVVAAPDGHLNGVVVAQMHDDTSDNIEICTQLSGGVIKLLCRINGTSVGIPTLSALYQTGIDNPGFKFDWKIEVGSFGYKVYFNDFTNAIIKSTDSGMPALTLSGLCYFKAGIYTQCKDSDIVDPNRFCRVELSNLKHFHTGWPDPTVKAAVGPIASVKIGTPSTIKNTGTIGSMNTTPALPAGIVDGDTLVGFHVTFHDQEGHTQTTAPTPGIPSGWSRKANNGAYMSLSATNVSPNSLYHAYIRLCMYYAKYDSTGVSGISAAPTFAFTAGTQTTDWASSVLVAYSGGVLTSDPTDVLGAFTTVDATPAVTAAASASILGPAAALTTTENGGIVFAMMVADYKISTGAVPTLSGDGLTWVECAEYGSGTGPVMTWALDYALIPAAQAVTSKQAAVTLAGTGKSIAQMWALAPTPASDPINRLRRRNRPLLVR
jgi:hypothetical protein